jgi:hypothetical protein
MFDETLRTLKAFESGQQVQIPIQVDDDGYFDRRCPDSECESDFKVLLNDWKAKVPDEAARCPFCGRSAEPSDFNTPEQTDYLKQQAIAAIMGQLGPALQSDAAQFNRRPQGGFITMRLEYKAPRVAIPVPPEAEKAMTLRVECKQCGCHFAVIGAGYFCPACGHNSADVTFEQAIAAARNAVASLSAIKAALPDRDAAAQVAKNLIEGTFCALVTAFQRYAEAEYPHLPAPTTTPRRNAFQSLSEGSALWHQAGGREYSAILSGGEFAQLTRYFQQRHLLQHREGIVDQDYIARSGDTTYAVGQRLVMREQAVVELADLLAKLTAGLRQDVAGKTGRT